MAQTLTDSMQLGRNETLIEFVVFYPQVKRKKESLNF